ncbi:hypothetical protein [Brazilian marseillevirus]|uniref:hypothetical protein n=1 Tax=Brazilian marseillevirus TaxID=1813599 RepID=UPI0007804961|nr:hypothetical protein A3303_gp150 [Brazilian marseillevirus]AMQ10658.1 hypothetical protein [Brazilian marseillevirus]
MAEKELRDFVRQYKEVFGYLPELEQESPLVTLLVKEKNKQIPNKYFSRVLQKDVSVLQEVSAPIIPY